VRKSTRSLPLLIVVATLATTLVLLFSTASAARPAIQDSPLQPPLTATETVTPFALPDIGAPTLLPEPQRPLPFETFPPLEAPTSVPVPPVAGPTPTVSGFLPAPTITNPDEVRSLPLARPPIAGGGIDEPFSTPTPRPPRNPALVASVAILNVLWLICGSALLLGGIAYIILLARRKSDR
jgi:hypothetical protein